MISSMLPASWPRPFSFARASSMLSARLKPPVTAILPSATVTPAPTPTMAVDTPLKALAAAEPILPSADMPDEITDLAPSMPDLAKFGSLSKTDFAAVSTLLNHVRAVEQTLLIGRGSLDAILLTTDCTLLPARERPSEMAFPISAAAICILFLALLEKSAIDAFTLARPAVAFAAIGPHMSIPDTARTREPRAPAMPVAELLPASSDLAPARKFLAARAKALDDWFVYCASCCCALAANSLTMFSFSVAAFTSAALCSDFRRADARRSSAATACVEPSPYLAMASCSLISATRTRPASSACFMRALLSSLVAALTSSVNTLRASPANPLEDAAKDSFSCLPSCRPLMPPAFLNALLKELLASSPVDFTSLLTFERKPVITGKIEICAEPTSDDMRDLPDLVTRKAKRTAAPCSLPPSALHRRRP